jgi:hypothetical protein
MAFRVPTLSLLLLFMAAAAYADNPVSRSYARDSGHEVRCRNATTLDRYTESLKETGWGRSNEPAPTFDFQKFNAVLIAPETFRSGHEIAVDSIDDDGDRMIVRWSWRAVHREGSAQIGGSSA